MSAVRDLPARPSLDSLRKQAKTLRRDAAAGNGDAIARVHAQSPRLEPISAVGTGDVLLAGFLAARLDGRSPEESLRTAVAAASVDWHGTALRVTVSVGGAALVECTPPGADALLRLADERLYLAKRAGRNRLIGAEVI